jgi:hypothetical protein
MTDRERWIVYPLLFLALGAALRDKLFDRTTTKSIICQELTVVDAEPIGNRPRILARIGRAEPHGGQTSSGHLFVNGQIDVQGVVNARQYAYQGVPFVPAIPTLPMGVTWPDLLRAMQQAAQARQQQNATTPQPPAQTPSPQTQPAEQSPPAEPLADPVETR